MGDAVPPVASGRTASEAVDRAGKNQEHNPEALRLLLYNVIKETAGKHQYKNQYDRLEKCLSLY